MRFQQLDLNLLRVLAAIYQAGSVTAAARRLSLSQPAASNALARLRGFLGDELFVRSPSGLRPTRRCEQLAPLVIGHLQSLEVAMGDLAVFEPATSDVHWRLSLSDLGEMMFLAPLAVALRTQAPHTRLTNVAVPVDRLGTALETREIDLAIGILQPARPGIHVQRLFQEGYVAVSAAHWLPAGHAGGDRLRLAQLRRAALIVPSPMATFHATVDQALVTMRLQDRIVLRPRHFGAVPDLVARTDLIAVVPQMYADTLRDRHGLKVWRFPGDGVPYGVSMVWHGSTSQDPSQVWLRGLCARLFGAAAGKDRATATATPPADPMDATFPARTAI